MDILESFLCHRDTLITVWSHRWWCGYVVWSWHPVTVLSKSLYLEGRIVRISFPVRLKVVFKVLRKCSYFGQSSWLHGLMWVPVSQASLLLCSKLYLRTFLETTKQANSERMCQHLRAFWQVEFSQKLQLVRMYCNEFLLNHTLWWWQKISVLYVEVAPAFAGNTVICPVSHHNLLHR